MRTRPAVVFKASAAATALVLVVCCQTALARAEEASRRQATAAGQQAVAQSRDLPGESQLHSPAPPETAPAQDQPQAEAPPSLTKSFVRSTDALGDNEHWKKISKQLTRQERDELLRFVEANSRPPPWLGPLGINDQGRRLLAAFSNAESFGLRARDYTALIGDPEETALPALINLPLNLMATALIYARHATAGRAAARKLGRQLPFEPEVRSPREVLEGLVAAEDPAQFLESLHPKHPQFVMLRRKLAELRDRQRSGAGPKIPAGPVLKRGVTHPHVVLLRRRLALGGEDGPTSDQKTFDSALEAAVKEFQRQNGLDADGIVGGGTRKALNGRSPQSAISKIVLNMERWRWLPDDLAGPARIYVWANIPELEVRVVQDGKTVFSERSIVGQPSHKTPIFSDRMEWIEFHPTWYVPASIKKSDILPSLRRPTSTVMERYNLRVDCGSHGTNWKAINWREIDISKCSFTQPPGKLSVLGDFKFKFPNRHAVYMHDTHDKRLFSRAKRMFSHGCIRVKNPRRLAEILLANDKGMAADAIGKILAGPKVLHKETFNRPVPVHITYFTAMFDDQGNFVMKPDYYGFDRQLDAVLNGRKPVRARRPAKAKQKKVRAVSQKDWRDEVLSAN